MSKVAIKATDLTCVFGHGKKANTAVNKLNFEIMEEEIVTVVGQSGSGKTTLARMILHLQPITSGTLLFEGKPITDAREHWRLTQAVFQDPFSSFNQFFTVKVQLLDCFNLLKEKFSKEEKLKRIRAALVSVRLDPDALLEKYPFELSGGQMQRLLIARIFVIRPKFLIADEPTSMIDASSRSAILDLLMELKKELKMCIIFITHDIGLAHYVSDRVFVMNKGEIVEQGKPADVISNPQHAYTKQLLNDIPILDKEWIVKKN